MGSITVNNLETLQVALQERYTLTIMDTIYLATLILYQGKEEALTAYYNRSYQVLRQSGGQDQLLGNRLFSTLKEHYLTTFIYQFILGLYDPKLKQEAIKQQALTADSLTRA